MPLAPDRIREGRYPHLVLSGPVRSVAALAEWTPLRSEGARARRGG